MFGQSQARPQGGLLLCFLNPKTIRRWKTSLANLPPAGFYRPAAEWSVGSDTTTSRAGVRIDVSNLRSTTRFNDLQEDLQRGEIVTLDEAIQRCIKDCEAVDAFLAIAPRAA